MQGLAPASAPIVADLRSQLASDRTRVSTRMQELLAAHRGGVYDLVAYHLGWSDADGAPAALPAGKMLRPLLCLAAARGFAGRSDGALDAAAAIELLHAFSLVHDDIEDGDTERHHRPTLWALRGVPLAINAGDCLFALAHRTLGGAIAALPPERALLALRTFDDACLRMIEGQHDDLEFESVDGIALDRYLEMSAGKTGALIGASLALGAIFSGAPATDIERMCGAGVAAGLAFQAIDDGLAVWGDAARTGKAVGNDISRGKKSLPAILALSMGVAVTETSVRAETQRIADGYARRAGDAIAATTISCQGRDELEMLIELMVRREA